MVKTGAGLVAARVDDDLPALQSVYLLHCSRDPDAPDEDALAALLCSALLGAYACYRWTAQKKVQPQLTLAELRALPVPSGLPVAEWRAIAELARARRLAHDTHDVSRLERALDERIAGAYGLVLDVQLEALRPALDALPRSQRPAWWR